MFEQRAYPNRTDARAVRRGTLSGEGLMADDAATGCRSCRAFRLPLPLAGWLLGVAVGSVALAGCASDAVDPGRSGAGASSQPPASRSSSEQSSGPSGGQTSGEPPTLTGGPVPAQLAALECFGKRVTMAGTPDADQLIGTRRRDVILARGGDDLVTGLDENDRVCSAAGDDRVEIESRNSYVRVDLGVGDDSFFGSAVLVRGGSGDDELRVVGNVSAEPGPGRDLVVTALVRDRYAAACLDYSGLSHRIVADLGRGWVKGQGVDRVRGVQCVNGTRFGDVITGSPRSDMLHACGFGAAYAADRVRNVIRARAGNDEVTLCNGGDLVYLGDGRDTAMGGEGADWVYGGADRDHIWGIGGSYHLFGGDGNDRVNGTFYCTLRARLAPGWGHLAELGVGRGRKRRSHRGSGRRHVGRRAGVRPRVRRSARA